MTKKVVLDNLFSIKKHKDNKHKILTVLGVKIKFKSNSDDKILKKIFTGVRKNSVLVVEPNDCHYEVMPGFIKYFQDLGYKTDIVVREKSAADFLHGIFPSDRIFYLTETAVQSLVADDKIRQYEYLLLTSSVKYTGTLPGDSPLQPSVTDYFKDIAFDFDKIIFVQHHMERSLNSNKQIALADLKNKYSENFYMVNPHYFGKVKITPKNEDVTKFIVVGNIVPWRKNYSLLLDAVRDLATKTKNFKVILVGGGGSLEIAEDIAGFFDVRGRLSYPDMFRAMEEADFFLCLLDPENPEHERYVTMGTSGSFQLIYGFAKPCLIHKYFADAYDFDNDNALVYDNNGDLSRLMAKAVAMNAKEYENVQQGLQRKEEAIYKLSLENLQQVITNASVEKEIVKDMISVIIPAYNASAYVEKCLQSVLGQTYGNLEVIVINDCSTDDTAEKAMAFKDKRLRVINLPKNQGQSSARNLGIREAKGEYLSFIDADDYIDADYYEKLHDAATKNDADVAVANTKLVHLDGRVSRTWLRKTTVVSFYDKFSLLPHGSPCDKLYRTQFLRKNRLYFPDGYIWEDNLYNLQTVYCANKLTVAADTFYYYIKNMQSTTRSPAKQQKRKDDCVYIVSKMLHFMKNKHFRKRERDLVINFILTHMATEEIRKDKKTAAVLKKMLGRMGLVVPEKFHWFSFSLRKKRLCVLGKYLWNGTSLSERKS